MAKAETKQPKLPKKLAECADELYIVREQRLAIQKDADKLRERERLLEEKIIQELPKGEASGISGKVANVRINVKTIPVVDTQNDGWTKLWAWIKAEKKGQDRFSILGKSLNRTAIKELQEADVEVPGVTTFTDVSVSCTKVK